MSMTLEELKEKLDKPILRFSCGLSDILAIVDNTGDYSPLDKREKEFKIEIIQAFIQFCEKENIVQVVEGELPGFENSRVGKDCFNRLWAFRKDMFKWHKQSLKPVSSLLGGDKIPSDPIGSGGDS